MSDGIMWWNYVNSEGGVASDAALRLGGRGWGAPDSGVTGCNFGAGSPSRRRVRVPVWLWQSRFFIIPCCGLSSSDHAEDAAERLTTAC